MTQERKITYMKMACGIVGFNFKRKDLDLMVSLYELILSKKGESTMMDVSKIEAEVDERNPELEQKTLPDS